MSSSHVWNTIKVMRILVVILGGEGNIAHKIFTFTNHMHASYLGLYLLIVGKNCVLIMKMNICLVLYMIHLAYDI